MPTNMLQVAAPPQAPPADKPPARRTGMLRVVPRGEPLADKPKSVAPLVAPAPAKPQGPAPAKPQGPVLPVPPDDDEKFRYVRQHAWILTLFSVASFPLLLFSQVRLMLQYHWFWVYSPCVLLAALFLALPLLTDGLSRSFDFAEHRRLVDSWHPPKYPSVDVFLPVCGEPIDVLRNT